MSYATDVAVVGIGVASATLEQPGDILDQAGAPSAGFDPAALLGRGVRYWDRATRLGALAAARALADSSLVSDGQPSGGLVVSGETVGVVASSNLGNLDTVCRTAEVIASESVVRTSPMDLANASSNVVASSIAIRFDLRGPNVMVCNGMASGLDAVHLAATLVASRRVARVLVVGVEPANDVVASLSARQAGELFDGAVAIVLESASAATSRGVAPRVRLGGYARCADTETSVARVLRDAPPPELWFATETTAMPTDGPRLPRRDLETTLGAASGALGVLQVAAGAHWLRTGRHGPVLATAGADEDGVASMLLTGPAVAA